MGTRCQAAVLGMLAVVAAALVIAGPARLSMAQEDALDPYPLRPPAMASPRDTLSSFKAYVREAVHRYQTRNVGIGFEGPRDKALQTLDLSGLPPALREDQGIERGLLLLEILDRIELPPLEEIPDAAAVEAEGITRWTIPNTEITIARTEEGPYAGKFQFSAHTVAQLPTFYEKVKHLPYKPGADIGVYEDLAHSPGELLPAEWVSNLPSFAYEVFLGQTLWQWLGAVAMIGLTALLVAVAYLAGGRFDHAGPSGTRRHLGRLSATVLAIGLVYLSTRFIDDGVHIIGAAESLFSFALGTALAVAVAWLILLSLDAIGEAIIRRRASGPGSVDAQLIRVLVRVLAIIVLIYVALHLAESFGIPAAPLLASLGVGGLAIALAVRPTLENVIGGFILFADKPVRVGEFCLFGDKMGTVEEVGLRSTRIRGLDRTLITVPNADFAQMQIVNFTRRDQMLLRTTLGLRYETTPDQLRYVLTRLRELFVAHPKVSPDPARARFIGFGDCSLDVEVFVYVLSEDYNEFLGIAEDINLRIMAIVSEAGTGFAFPSQTAYVARDRGLDAERVQAVEAEVEAWRAEGTLPFPALDPRRVAALDGSLDFPPEGSHQHRQPAEVTDHGRADATTRRHRWSRRRSRQTSGP
jgi:MscS family membrane protein